MANQLKMAKIQAILELHQQGWSQRAIASTLQIDRGTVSRYVRRTANAAIPPTGSRLRKKKSASDGESTQSVDSAAATACQA